MSNLWLLSTASTMSFMVWPGVLVFILFHMFNFRYERRNYKGEYFWPLLCFLHVPMHTSPTFLRLMSISFMFDIGKSKCEYYCYSYSAAHFSYLEPSIAVWDLLWRDILYKCLSVLKLHRSCWREVVNQILIHMFCDVTGVDDSTHLLFIS